MVYNNNKCNYTPLPAQLDNMIIIIIIERYYALTSESIELMSTMN